MKKDVLVITHYEVGDVTFDSDVGSWNVTRCQKDCDAGKHRTYTFVVDDVYEHNKSIEVEEKKISSMIADTSRLLRSPPLIFIVENGLGWLIDGHHRLRALHAICIKEFTGYIIEGNTHKYKIFFNGERVSPWMNK